MSQRKEACRALLESYTEVKKSKDLPCQPFKAFVKHSHQQTPDSLIHADCRKEENP